MDRYSYQCHCNAIISSFSDLWFFLIRTNEIIHGRAIGYAWPVKQIEFKLFRQTANRAYNLLLRALRLKMFGSDD